MNGETEEIMTGEEDGGMETEYTEDLAASGADQNETGPAGGLSERTGSGSQGTDRSGAKDSSAAAEERNGAAELRAALSRARERVTQLERERSLLSQGVPEEDLDYYVFKIGKLVTGEKDFDTAAKEFLKQRGAAHGTTHRAPATHSTGASLAGRSSGPRSTNDTMNRILRGN